MLFYIINLVQHLNTYNNETQYRTLWAVDNDELVEYNTLYVYMLGVCNKYTYKVHICIHVACNSIPDEENKEHIRLQILILCSCEDMCVKDVPGCRHCTDMIRYLQRLLTLHLCEDILIYQVADTGLM